MSKRERAGSHTNHNGSKLIWKISGLEYCLGESQSIIQPRFEKCFLRLNIASASPCLYWGKVSVSDADFGRIDRDRYLYS
jgi:hypothetical protein